MSSRLEGIRRASAFDPDWPVPRALEGQFLFMARRYEESLERLDALVAVEPGFATGHVMRMIRCSACVVTTRLSGPTIALWRCGASSASRSSSIPRALSVALPP